MSRRRPLRGPLAFLIYGPNWLLVLPTLAGVAGFSCAIVWAARALIAKFTGSP